MHYQKEPFNSFPPKFGSRLAQLNDENNVSFQLHLGTSSCWLTQRNIRCMRLQRTYINSTSGVWY